MLLKFLKDFPQFLFILCIQPLGWFIHQKKPWLQKKYFCQCQTLLFSSA